MTSTSFEFSRTAGQERHQNNLKRQQETVPYLVKIHTRFFPYQSQTLPIEYLYTDQNVKSDQFTQSAVAFAESYLSNFNGDQTTAYDLVKPLLEVLNTEGKEHFHSVVQAAQDKLNTYQAEIAAKPLKFYQFKKREERESKLKSLSNGLSTLKQRPFIGSRTYKQTVELLTNRHNALVEVMDINEDGHLDQKELAAGTILQDNIVEFMKKSSLDIRDAIRMREEYEPFYRRVGQASFIKKSDEIAYILLNTSSKFDGEVSKSEYQTFTQLLSTAPKQLKKAVAKVYKAYFEPVAPLKAVKRSPLQQRIAEGFQALNQRARDDFKS